MKICYLFSNYQLRAITAEPKMAMEIATKALKNGHEVHIISNNTKSEKGRKDGMHFFLFKGLGDLKTFLFNTPAILRHLTEVKPDILHVHGGIIIIYAAFLNFFLRLLLIFSFCESLDMFEGLQKNIFLFCLSRMPIIFTTSSHEKNQLTKNGIRENAIQITRLGLEDEFLKTWSLKTKDADIFFFGDASYERGFDIVYSLAKKLPTISFKILIRWEVDCVDELREMQKLPNVKLYRIPYKESLVNMIIKSNMILLPFRSMGVRPPLSIIESMALGKCVFTSTMEGNEELIRNNENGVLSDFTNINTVAKQICSLIESPSRLKRIGKNARKTILLMYSDKEYTKIIDYYALIKS